MDRGKVIDRLQKVSRYFKSMLKVGYDGDSDIYKEHRESVKMAIELLKEQEAKWIHREDMDFIDKYNCTHFHGMCTNCGLVHDFIDGHTGQYLYCPQCGRSVKWE